MACLFYIVERKLFFHFHCRAHTKRTGVCRDVSKFFFEMRQNVYNVVSWHIILEDSKG